MHNSILSCYVCIMVVGPNWQLSCREGGGARGMELPPGKETGSSKWVHPQASSRGRKLALACRDE
jgi:hypothetical protein